MSILNFNTPNKVPRSSRPLKLILGIGALAGVIALGSTLASNIGLNSGAPIEFGQGVAQTTSCDHEVTLAPISTFVNADGAGEFKFTGVSLSGLDTTDQSGPSEGCAGKTFTFKIYNEQGVENSTSYTLTVGSASFGSAEGDPSAMSFGEDGAVTLNFDPITIAATDVYRITIESKETPPSQLYAIGDPGPAGGTVFYYSEAGFSEVGAPCGSDCHYLEWAPSTWGQNNLLGIDYSTDRSNSVGVTSELLGGGFHNTALMLISLDSGNGRYTYAAAHVVELYNASNPGGVSDWFIPSIGELDLMSASTVTAGGGFQVYNYWSSSEYDAGNAWLEFLISSSEGGGGVIGDKNHYSGKAENPLRPIRAF